MSKTHTGVILEIGEVKAVTDKFQKRRFVVDEVYSGQYGDTHNPVPFFLTQEKCGIIDEYKVGQKVTVHFDVNSRPWIKDGVHQLNREGETSYFVEIRAWKIEAVAEQAQTPVAEQAPAPAPSTVQTPPASGSPSLDDGFDPNPPDDLPF